MYIFLIFLLFVIQDIEPGSEGKKIEDFGALQEYNKHKCSGNFHMINKSLNIFLGYNIAANFLNKENYIITGSEDNQVIEKTYYFIKIAKNI